MKIKIGSLFSGIGAFETALKKIGIEHEILFACDNGERYLDISIENELLERIKGKNNLQSNKIIKDFYNLYSKKTNYVKKTYFKNHNISEENWYEDIRYIDFKEYVNKLDLIVGGSPCQSFSVIGKRKGIDDARGTLFYDYVRSIKDSRPKMFIYENVMGIKTIDGGNTWKRMLELFEELDYKIKVFELNSLDFGIPQNRKRIFICGFLNTSINNLHIKKSKLNKKMSDFLVHKVDEKYYLGEKGFKFVTNPKYKSRAKVNNEIIMCQKANQQFNWNGDFIFEPGIKNNRYIGIFQGIEGSIRKLTPQECLLLMGFPSDFQLPESIPDQQKYRQIGNSIVVNVLKEIIDGMLKVYKNEKN